MFFDNTESQWGTRCTYGTENSSLYSRLYRISTTE